MYGIVYLAVVPVRYADSEASEMLTQLLYGEMFEVICEKDKWIQICNLADNYMGWVDKKMVELLSDLDANILLKNPCSIVNKSKVDIIDTNNTSFLLPGASIIRTEMSKFHCQMSTFSFSKNDLNNKTLISKTEILSVSYQFLNAPYLWGGKTVFGIDCSGFVQVVYRIAGYQLPRDASQQIEIGTKINSLNYACEGDLVFFENDNKRIVHVGILISKNEVIHASGWVKIEKIDSKGIISSVNGSYTHVLADIKRVF